MFQDTKQFLLLSVCISLILTVYSNFLFGATNSPTFFVHDIDFLNSLSPTLIAFAQALHKTAEHWFLLFLDATHTNFLDCPDDTFQNVCTDIGEIQMVMFVFLQWLVVKITVVAAVSVPFLISVPIVGIAGDAWFRSRRALGLGSAPRLRPTAKALLMMSFLCLNFFTFAPVDLAIILPFITASMTVGLISFLFLCGYRNL